MLTEPLPCRLFIRSNLDHKDIKRVIDVWRLDYTTIVDIVEGHFFEMGWFVIEARMEGLARETMVNLLKYAPDMLVKVDEAERRERQLARTKKSLAD